MICEPVERSVKAFVREWRQQKIHRDPIMTYKLHIPHQPGKREIDKAKFYYIHPEIRNLFSQMVRFVCYLHGEELSMNPYTVDDIWMMGHVIKFCGIGFIKATRFSRKADFVSLMNVFKNLFDPAAAIPNTLNDLFTSVNVCTFQHETKNYLLEHHLALAPPKVILAFLSKCRDVFCENKISALTSNKPIVDDMWVLKGWKSKFMDEPAKHKLMVEIFEFRPSSSKDADQYVYTQSGVSYEVKISLMRFLRNFDVHVNDRLSLRDKLKDEEKEAVLLGLYCREIMQSQVVLFQNSMLHNFMPHSS